MKIVKYLRFGLKAAQVPVVSALCSGWKNWAQKYTFPPPPLLWAVGGLGPCSPSTTSGQHWPGLTHKEETSIYLPFQSTSVEATGAFLKLNLVKDSMLFSQDFDHLIHQVFIWEDELFIILKSTIQMNELSVLRLICDC